MRGLECRLGWLFMGSFWLATASVAAQPAGPETPAPPPATPADAPGVDSESALTPDGGATELSAAVDGSLPEEAQRPEPAEPPPPPRGDVPVSPESVMNPDAPPESADGSVAPGPTPQAKPAPLPSEPATPRVAERLIVWAAASWASSLGPGHCGPNGLEQRDAAIRIAATLKRSAASAGIGVAPAGALADHPLIAHAAETQPQLVAALLADIGFAVIAVGVADVNGPLLREPRLSLALQQRGVAVIATNLVCGGQVWCESWATAEDPLLVVEREGRRYALISVLPDDVLGRVEPAAGRPFALRSAADTLVERTAQARAAGVDLVVASIDHGPDATASVNLANFLADLPPDIRPDLLLSPSAGDNLLFLRPLDVHPAVVGTRSGVLLGLRVTKLPELNDADVFARSVRVNDWDDSIASNIASLGTSYCKARGGPLPGGQLDAAMASDELVLLAADSARELTGADLAVLDPLAYDDAFRQPKGSRLQRGQMEGAVELDSPLVVAEVSLDWLASLNKLRTGLRPLTLVGTGTDRGDAVIAGRIPIPGALYRIVTSAVLARSGRLPDGAAWSTPDTPKATLRGALLAQLEAHAQGDPRSRVHDPIESTQWVLRADGQVQADLTTVDNPGGRYDEPALKVNDSRQLGLRLLLNLDADAPHYIFENALQIAFDRNFTTRTTAQDLVFLQTTYTYRGLWPEPLLYPHPFIEAYVETEFDQGDARYRHLLLRPEAGFRSMVSRVLSLKLSAGGQSEVLAPNSKIYPGMGAELLLKPSLLALSHGTIQIEGSVTYYWNAPGTLDQHTLRGQLITAVQLFGPLQFTLSALAALRKDRGVSLGTGLGLQAGVRLRLVERTMVE